jgi:two-component system phosphate regulon sensor histidine kinase PhoR
LSGIQLRLAGILAALVVGVVGLSGYLVERQIRDQELARLEESLLERAQLVRELTALLDFSLERHVEIDPIVDRLGLAAEARVTLIAADGTVIADSEVATDRIPAVENHADRPEIVAAREGGPGRHTRLSATVGRRLLYVAIPAHSPPDGSVVRLSISTESIDAAAADLRASLLQAGLAGLLVAALLALAISWLTVRPVMELRDVVAAIASGRLDRRLRWSERGWMAEIARSINRMAEQLREQLMGATAEKERLEAVLASMVEGVLVLEGGRIVLANPRARELLTAWREVEGRRPLEVIRHAEIDAALTEAATSREPVVRELVLGDAGGRTLLMHAVAFPPGDEPTGTVAVFHDVSDIRKLEQVRRDFIANASHELRTPLTSIRGFADTLLSSDLSKEEAEPYLEVIVRNAERLGNLIEDLLALSRIESRKVPLRLAPVDVAHVCRTLASDLAPRLAEAGLTLELDTDDAEPAWADRQAVEQVVSNLLENAVKYTDRGGHIRVAVQADQGRLRVRVEDDGIGIPEADQSRIFERFYRVDKARSRALGGTGLGLSIVKHLVQAMGGEITVESEVGRGSCFQFSLPLAAGATTGSE